MNNRKLKNYFLDFKFQSKVIVFFLIINLITITCLYFAANEFFNIFVNKARELGIPKTHSFYSFLSILQNQMNINFFKYSLVSSIVTFCGSLYMSHKLSGPIYRIKKEFKQMSENKKIHKVRFRQNDGLQELEENINALYETYN